MANSTQSSELGVLSRDRGPVDQDRASQGNFGYSDNNNSDHSNSSTLFIISAPHQIMNCPGAYERIRAESRQGPPNLPHRYRPSRKTSNPGITEYESTCTSIEDESQAGSEFKERTKTAAAGHRFQNVKVEGKVHIGDTFNNEWNGKTNGRVSHIYDGIKITKEGRALMGNKFGGKDFWDE